MACEDFWKALSSWFCRTTNKFLSEMAYQTQPGLLASLHHTKNCQQDTPKSRTQAGVGWGLQKICGAMDGGAEAPQGCAARSGFLKAPPHIRDPKLTGKHQTTNTRTN
jgi:hypothetical protein